MSHGLTADKSKLKSLCERFIKESEDIFLKYRDTVNLTFKADSGSLSQMFHDWLSEK